MDYNISLKVRGATMFATIMDLVEKNPEIRVLKAEMELKEPAKLKRPTQNRSGNGEHFEDKYYSFLLSEHERKLNEGSKFVEITSNDAMAWCAANGYARSSGTSLTSLMVKRGLLAKTQTRGIFRILHAKPELQVHQP